METQYVSIEEYQDNQWYYSAEWEEQVKPGYYIGKFYLSGNVIWFDVVKQLKHIYSQNLVIPAILDHDYDSCMKYFQSLIRHQKRVKERDKKCDIVTLQKRRGEYRKWLS